MITVSDVIEYLFCPRYIYFMHCLAIPQHEEQYFKVKKGRSVHQEREKTNIAYLRQDLQVERKEIAVYLASEPLRAVGIVDEVLFFKDGTASPLDYKYAEYQAMPFRTHTLQSVIYGLLIAEHFDIPCNRGLLVYTRSHNLVKEIPYTPRLKAQARTIIEEIFCTIQDEIYPPPTNSKVNCLDCCYRRICDSR